MAKYTKTIKVNNKNTLMDIINKMLKINRGQWLVIAGLRVTFHGVTTTGAMVVKYKDKFLAVMEGGLKPVHYLYRQISESRTETAINC